MNDIFTVAIDISKLNMPDLSQKCYKIKNKYKSVAVSNIGGYQSPILNPDDLKEITPVVLEQAKQYNLKTLKLKGNLRILNYWLNINTLGNYNTTHRHPFTFISAVLYVKAPKNSGKLVFHNEHPLDLFFEKQELKEFNKFNSTNYDVHPEDNLLIIFPGYLKHSVEPSLSTEDRISIAFNLG